MNTVYEQLRPFLKAMPAGRCLTGFSGGADSTALAFLLAGAREYSGQHEEALALLEQYTEEIGTSPEMLNLKGNALCGLGKYKEALACFEQALPLSQDGTALRQSLLFNRIAAVENMRDFKRAKELAAEYAELYPKDTRMERENLFLQTR